MDTINSMKKTLGERIREQRILMQMTQEELAEELCVKKSTISMYENDKVDIKGSILIELSGVLHTSPNYLLGMEDYEEDLLEIITVYKNLKGSKTKQIALEQMKLLATMCIFRSNGTASPRQRKGCPLQTGSLLLVNSGYACSFHSVQGGTPYE